MSSSNVRSYEFLRSFKSDFNKFGQSIVFHPMFFSSTCKDCISGEHFTENENCLSGGRYCAPIEVSETSSLHVNGSQIMLEDLRQYCINRDFPEQFFSYASNYFESCLMGEVDDLQNCSSTALKKTGIKAEAVSECVSETFGGKENFLLDDNLVLRKMKEAQDALQIPFYPDLLLNNISYRVNQDYFLVSSFSCLFFGNKGRVEQILRPPSHLLSLLAGTFGVLFEHGYNRWKGLRSALDHFGHCPDHRHWDSPHSHVSHHDGIGEKKAESTNFGRNQ